MEEGFYKYESELEFAPSGIICNDWILCAEEHETLTYPIHGWYWFNSRLEAETFFKLK